MNWASKALEQRNWGNQNFVLGNKSRERQVRRELSSSFGSEASEGFCRKTWGMHIKRVRRVALKTVV